MLPVHQEALKDAMCQRIVAGEDGHHTARPSIWWKLATSKSMGPGERLAVPHTVVHHAHEEAL
jgi:hypothetical protein